MSERVAVFIDGGYFDKILERLSKPRVDYEKFSDKMCAGMERFRTYYYHCMPHQSKVPTDEERQRYSKMDRFIHHLRQLRRFEIRLGRLQFIDGQFKQKGIDVLMSIDLVELAATTQICKAILVTGDSDFAPAVKRAKEKGVMVHLFYSPNTVHAELYEACDDRTILNGDYFRDCLRI